jgi:hypothetical protein
MDRRGEVVDRHGRVWTARVVGRAEEAEEDFRFWHENLTPEQRVEAVADCLLSALQALGIGIDRFDDAWQRREDGRYGAVEPTTSPWTT